MNALQLAVVRARVCPKPNGNGHDHERSIEMRLEALEKAIADITAKLSTPVNGCGRPSGAPKPRPTIASIKQIVCAHYRLLETELISQMRSKDAVWARQITMYLCARYTMQSLPTIGRLLGGRDHTTVLHGRNKIAARRAEDPTVQAELDALEAKITA